MQQPLNSAVQIVGDRRRRVREGKNLQFRGELFNAFNHPSFTTVGRTLNTTATGVNPLASNFGVVTDTRDARVVQFALKLTF